MKIRNTLAITLATVALLFFTAVIALHAGTITVINTNDSGPGSLRQALADANDGDTITFTITGTIGLTTAELLVDKSVTISGPGADNLAVNGNAKSRVFYIASGKTVTMSDLTITNGNPPGDPPDDYREAYEVMLAAYEAGRAACAAGMKAADVNAACRAPIEAAGLGEHFRHRMGHGIGMDVHERPFLSEEDQTPLEPGMTFTDEPSIIIPDRFSVRIENIVVCEEGGGRILNDYPAALVANS